MGDAWWRRDAKWKMADSAHWAKREVPSGLEYMSDMWLHGEAWQTLAGDGYEYGWGET